MKVKNNPPFAPNLIESMRSIGYSFETALADIVDNSIAAKANNIDIFINAADDSSHVAILDDGEGMNKEELFYAMKYGSTNPNSKRKNDDLGRFGLGLKSASLSQCRKLTVLSKNNSLVNGYIWDIDYIIKSQEWNILELEFEELNNIPYVENLMKLESGTLVLWENLDRLQETSSNVNSYLIELSSKTINHFSLIYHRLINKNRKISINGFKIEPRDPFLEYHTGTQIKREQMIHIDDSKIIVKPYILPHINKLSSDDIKKLGGKETLRTEQGFYIYRNKRLIIWGTWFRLTNKEELFKLARVRVDIPNDLDYLWDIDIKKSRASIPNKIKTYLYNAVNESCDISQNVHQYRGRKALNNKYYKSWNIIQHRKGEGLDLEINLDNPLFSQFIDTLSTDQKKVFLSLMKDIETSIPLDYIYNELAKGKKTSKEKTSKDIDDQIEQINYQYNAFKDLGMDQDEIIRILLNHELYAKNKILIEYIKNLKGKE